MLKIFEGFVKNDDITMIKVHGFACTPGACAAIYGKPDIGKYVDVTSDYFVTDSEKSSLGLPQSSADRLIDDLARCGWDIVEREYIAELLRRELAKSGR